MVTTFKPRGKVERNPPMATVKLKVGDLIHINGIPLRIVKEGEATTHQANVELLGENYQCNNIGS
jgi:hypothetical protein